MSRILIVWQSDYPWDVRIDKFVRSFCKYSHEVVVLANNRFQNDPVGSYMGAKVVRLRRYAKPLPFSSEWARAVEAVLDAERPDVVLVRDIPLFYAAYFRAVKRGIPVWLDMAEDYPALFLDMKRSFVERCVLRNYWLARAYEAFAVRNSHVLTVVCEEARDRVLRMSVKADNVYVIGNYPDSYFLSRLEQSASVLSGSFRLVYTGWADWRRGLHTVVEAIALQLKLGRSIKWVIAGGRPDEIVALKRHVSNRLPPGTVEFLGHLPYLDLAGVISRCDVGIVPHLSTLHTRTTVPNKLFDYMAVGKPVIVSNLPPLERIVLDTGAGMVFRAGDASSLSECLGQMYTNAEQRRQMGQRALEASRTRFRWELEEETILNILGQLSTP